MNNLRREQRESKISHSLIGLVLGAMVVLGAAALVAVNVREIIITLRPQFVVEDSRLPAPSPPVVGSELQKRST